MSTELKDSLPETDYIQALLAKTYNNKMLTLTIFKKLFSELPVQLGDIRNALSSKDYQTALDITHKMHGSLSFCGFSSIQEYAHELEFCLLKKDYDFAKNWFLSLQIAIIRFLAQEHHIIQKLEQS